MPDKVRLIVLDGTWRKTRKLLHLNPWLQALPRLGLPLLPASRYTVRRAHRPDQLATLEATGHALHQFDLPTRQLEALMDGFDGFNAQLRARDVRAFGNSSR